MLKKRKPQPNTVLTYSIVLGLVLGAAAAYEAYHQGWVWAAVWGLLALWFFVDAFRAYGWLKNTEIQQQEAERAVQAITEKKEAERAAGQQSGNVFAKSGATTPATRPATQIDQEESGVAHNPLIERDELK